MVDQRDKSMSASFYPCAATRHSVNQPKSVVSNTDEEAGRAALTVARNALDVKDCRQLLDMLGLELTGEEQS